MQPRSLALFPTALALAAFSLASCGGGSGGSSTVAPTALTYGSLDETYIACAAIAPNSPAVTGGSAITGYSVAPALPSGLTLDTTTGIIAGTPDALAADATFTVTATNPAGSASADLMIQVDAPPAPSALSYASANASYPTGTAITPNTPTVTGNITSWSIAPTLPSGLQISATSGVITGTPTAITAQATYTVTATDCLGDFTTGTLQIATPDGGGGPITGDAPRFAYAANAGDGTLSIFEFDGNTGRLAAAGYTATGGAPTDLVASPDDTELFVLDGANDAVRVYSIDASTGQLTAIGGSPFALPTASGASGLALTPDGTRLYVANTNLDSISAFTVATDGNLGAITGSPFVTGGTGPVDVVVASDGARLFGICRDSDQLFGQDIAGDGALSAEVLAATQDQPAAIATIENGDGNQVVFLGYANSNNLQTALSGATGALLVFETQAVAGNVSALEAVEFAGGGQVLYACNTTAETVQRLTIETGGQLTPIVETTTVNEFDPIAIEVARDGSTSVTLYELRSELSTASVDAGNSGELTLINVGAQPLDRNRLRSTPSDVVIVHGAATQARSSTALLSANFSDGDVSQFSFDGTGLAAQTPFTVAAGEGPNSIAIHPRLNKAYVVNNSDTMGADLQVFDLDSAGRLTGTPTAVDAGSAASNGTWTVHIGPSANFLFAIRSDLAASDVLSYPIDAAGNLGTPTTGTANVIAFGGAVDPTERFFYVANSGSSNITAFSIDAATGGLTKINDFATGNAPSGLQVDPSGRFLYVVNRGDGTISGFSISAATGALTAVSGAAGTVSTGTNPIAVTIDAFGRHVFVANQGDSTLDTYRINVNPGNATANGSLVGLSTTNLSGAPRAMRLDAANSALFVGTSDTGSVLTYGFDDQSGSLTLNDTESSGTAITRALATYPR